MTLDSALVISRVRNDPVCEHRDDGGYCPKLSVSAVVAQSGNPASLRDYRSRCADHADPAAPRVCLGCRTIHDGRGPRCRSCSNVWLDPRGRDR